ncbi:hypothetical protein AAL_00520 [Moelleriella libera RCEF 2490]|uniref:Uncharacterized protein n=1 Tax=Moelleriella libera RCEF 2490 TaxID=1081109 RepID=A0A166RP34_9HYPO|nr:hypothetical protein AAL_00520 [Moelleriella libera RCEF 2490]
MKFTYQVILSVLAFGSALNAAPVETSLEERAPAGAGFNDRANPALGLGTSGAGFNDRANPALGLGTSGAGFNDRANPALGLGTSGAGFNDRANPALGLGTSGATRPKSPAGAGAGRGNRGGPSDKLIFSP